MGRKGNRGKLTTPAGVVAGMGIELPVQVALSALGTGWLKIGHIDEIFVQGLLAYKLGHGTVKLQGWRIIESCMSIRERYRKLNRVGCNTQELFVLRQCTIPVTQWVMQQPAHIIKAVLEKGT